MNKIHITLMALIMTIHPVDASEEEFVPLDTVAMTIRTAETREAGAVTVEASTKAGAFTSLVIQAFGRSEKLEKADLEMLQGYPLAGILITREAGYESSGGPSVNLRFKRAAGDGGKPETLVVIVAKNAKPKLLKMPVQ